MRFEELKQHISIWVKIVCLLLCVLLLSVSVVGMVGETSYAEQCGQICSCHLQQPAMTHKHSSLPICCSETQSHTCHLSKNQFPVTQDYFLLPVGSDYQVSLGSMMVVTADFSTPAFQQNRKAIVFVEATAHSAPLYLQHNSLLC